MLGLARSSCFYHRARLLLADKYAAARGVMQKLNLVNNAAMVRYALKHGLVLQRTGDRGDR